MLDRSPEIAARITLCVADEAEARRVAEMLRKPGGTPADIAVTRVAAEADFVLPPQLGNEALRLVVELAARIAVLGRQLAESQHKEAGLVELAATDPLTGLPNRRAWDEALSRLPNGPMCIAILDLDQFKQVNDAHGHTIGDAVLRAAADGLRGAVRRGDLAARLGGDEFALLLPGLAASQAPAVVERIRRHVNAAIEKAGLPTTTCSAGFAVDLSTADAALRRAKQSGRNQTAAPPNC
jgi:diguanylate cyclase (GGDEF)-like protein